MNYYPNGDLVGLINNCKSELLNHVLQDQVASDHIKKVSKYLDNCLDVLTSNNLRESINSRRPRIIGNSKNNALFFAYCMSRYDHPFMEAVIGEKLNQSEAFSYLAEKLNVKPATLRNYRDLFDPHVKQTRSDRQGWQKEITPAYQSILDQYNSENEAQLIDEAKSKLGLVK